LTAEQMRIAHHKLQKDGNELIKIVAFAGTGKTTTLIKMCQEHPNLNFLVVMYNKGAREHAETVFPRNNTKCVTAHSLAYNTTGKFYRHKFAFNLKAKDIMDSNCMSESGGSKHSGSFAQKAAQVLQTVQNFLNSPDNEISMENVPIRWLVKRSGINETNHEITLEPKLRAKLMDDAVNVWNAMIDKDNMEIRYFIT
jgi:F-box protein 18 (helicase)